MRSSVLTPLATAQVVFVDDEAVVVDEATGRLALLNGPGAIVWQCLDGESTLEEICLDIADELEVSFETVLADSERLITELAAQGLVTGPGLSVEQPAGEPNDACGCDDHGHDHEPAPPADPRLVVDPGNY